jgi:hypothetical protein
VRSRRCQYLGADQRTEQHAAGTFGEQNMSKFGITADKDGKLSIDSKVLEEQLKNDPQTVAQFFNGNDGLIKSMDKSLDKYQYQQRPAERPSGNARSPARRKSTAKPKK